MFRAFRSRGGRATPKPTPPPQADSNADDLAFGRAWADYVEWSGLDEDKVDNPRGGAEDS